MRYQQTAIHIYGTPDEAESNVTVDELKGLLVATAGFIVFVAIFAFVAFGDSLG
ncbi:MAG TPA: hypothetical protein VG755_43920 [Nannocystaceae bacterium]|nr:hypothetical protein [Nannocystaceae bacterium]